MIRRIVVYLLILSLFISSSLTAYACDEEQTNLYVLQILFGDSASQYETNSEVEKLISALYLCSEQVNGNGQDKLNLLRKANVSQLPVLEKISISSDSILAYSHNSWDCESEDKIQKKRKSILKNTVLEVFDFGFINEKLKSERGKVDSFTALLYYSHILADYLADDPIDTRISAKGYDIPAYSGQAFFEINGGIPEFTNKQKLEVKSYKEYSDLDDYKRCGAAISLIGPDTLELVEEKKDISKIHPSGWVIGNKKYEGLIANELYNRCHVVAHSLGGADTRWNLMTGTRYLNEAMEKKEQEVANHIKQTGNHVLYRVTPVYVGDNRVASGVQMEAYSIEDKGKLQFNVYIYNVQPGVNIDYANGSSERADLVFGQDKIIPFAMYNASDKNPDLMYEIGQELEILFSEQKESTQYRNMMNELTIIENETRRISGNKDVKGYQKLKEQQYKYVDCLSKYIPKLLKNEEFFSNKFFV